jgi:hypothetical protein
MAPTAVPETLKDGWPGIVGGVLKIFKDLPAAVEGQGIFPAWARLSETLRSSQSA